MKKLIFLSALLIAACPVFFGGTANAQITFQKYYSGANIDYIAAAIQCTDGGFMIAGSTESFGGGGFDIFLIKTDASGDTIMTRTFGENGGEEVSAIQQCTDGGYIMCGGTLSNAIIIKTDSLLNTQWASTTSGDYLYSVQQTTDGGFIFLGRWDFGGNSDMWLVKTDVNGNTTWSKTYGGPLLDWGYSVQQTTDGGYILAGITRSFGQGNEDIYLIKTDAGGNMLWTKTYGGATLDVASTVKETVDGGYIIGGYTNSFGVGAYDILLLKTDSLGAFIWSKTYGNGGVNDFGYSVQQTDDGGYVIAGYGLVDGYLIKTDSVGATMWTKSYGFGNVMVENLRSVEICADGGFILGGNKIPANSEIYLVKTDANGNSGCLQGVPVLSELNAPFVAGSGGVAGTVSGLNSATYTPHNAQPNVWQTCIDSGHVWPGDANYDLIANNLDLLPIGIAYGTNGPLRPGATINWVVQTAPDWIDTLNNGVNYKHIDCNGDGIIDFADTNALALNYGFVHNKTTTPNTASPVDPDLYVEITPTTVPHNTPITADLNLGTVGIPADSIYGLAFTINFNPLLMDSASINLNIINSWLGTVGTDMIKLDKKFYGNGQVDVGIVRIDQVNSSGNGKIGELNFTAVNNSPTDEVLTISISDVTVIANNESIRNVNLGADSVIVQSSVGINENGLSNANVRIYPNPTTGEFSVVGATGEIQVYDLFGRKVLESKEPQIDMSNYPAGLYIWRVGEARGKLIIE